ADENESVENPRRAYVVGRDVVSARAYAFGADDAAPKIERGENHSARRRTDADSGAEGLSQDAGDDLLERAGNVAARRRVVGRQNGNGCGDPRLLETRVAGGLRQVLLNIGDLGRGERWHGGKVGRAEGTVSAQPAPVDRDIGRVIEQRRHADRQVAV